MPDLQTALAAAARPLPGPAGTPSARQRVLLAGGGGALGAAVLERLLAEHRFERVGVLAEVEAGAGAGGPLLSTVKRLQPVAPDVARMAAFGADAALIVFDRPRHANGREAAFLRPEPAELPALAAQLHAAGVRVLAVVVPHNPALMPAALRAGLASLDEGRVAGLGFAQLAFMRTARPGGVTGVGGAEGLNAPQRLAAWMLAQMHWLVPQRELPVNTATVARVAVALTLALRDAARAGAPADGASRTRVLAPEWLWHAAQTPELAPLLARWLAGEAPPPATPRQRW